MIKKTNEKSDFIFKIILIGDGGVGKTCMVERFCYDRFFADTSLTIGVNFNLIQIKALKGDKPILIDLVLWDLGGQGKFFNLIPYFSEGTDGIIYTFDSSGQQQESLENIARKWQPILASHVKDNAPCMLVGTKSDLRESSDKAYSPLEIESVRKEIDAFAAVFTSAKEDKNVVPCILQLVEAIVNRPIYQHHQIKPLERILPEIDL
jgi:small GTP-binding protein